MLYFRFISVYLGGLLLLGSAVSLGSGGLLLVWKLTYFLEFSVMTMNGVEIIFLVLLDWVSLIFMGIVTLISGLVLLYSVMYMSGDKNFYRFILTVYLFVVSMGLLIVSPNLVSLLLGWDGLGLVSYCLVIYYQNPKSSSAGLLTVLSNRVGDVALLISIAWLFSFGGWNFVCLGEMLSRPEVSLVVSLCMLGAMTKSAQIPFSAWLPAAMAAPTPVSSLVHSSTLVTAGVYMLIRFGSLASGSEILLSVSLMTMIMAGLSACLEMDFKSVIALSTLSQLGVMMFSISVGLGDLAFFHLLTHALFKSLLFLCAGVFIHSMASIQGVSMIGGLMSALPVTSTMFMGASLSLCGFPFLSGFYSSDLIVEGAVVLKMGAWGGLVLYISMGLTLIYSVRLISMLMLKGQGSIRVSGVVEEGGMIYPMLTLFVMSVFMGEVMGSQLFVPLVSFFSFMGKFFISLVLLTSLVYSLSTMNKEVNSLTPPPSWARVSWFIWGMWMLPQLSMESVGGMGRGVSMVSGLDQGWVELFGAQGLSASVSSVSTLLDAGVFKGVSVGLTAVMMMLLGFLLY